MQKTIPRWIHFLAVGTTVLTWLLIILGGVVHGTGSSLACPDWPTCYGSFFPEMKGGIFFEHSHRVVAATVGLLTVILWIALLIKGTAATKKCASVALFLVIFQGVLGGITVLFRLPTAVSTAHLATSMIFFANLAYLSLQTAGRAPERALPGTPPAVLRPLRVALILVFLQIVLGALVRHTGSGLACLDIPLCQGQLWPAEGSALAKIQMAHRWGGVLVALALAWTALVAWRERGLESRNRMGIALALVLLVSQIGLGLWSVGSGLALLPVSLHLALGALLWIQLVILYIRLAPSFNGPIRVGAPSLAGALEGSGL